MQQMFCTGPHAARKHEQEHVFVSRLSTDLWYLVDGMELTVPLL